MDELLQEIKMLPGVNGVFVYVDQPDVIFSDVPDGYDHDTLKQLEVSLERIFKMNASSALSINSIEMLFEDTMVLVKHVTSGASLVILCDPEANFPLINMTSNMLVSEIGQAVSTVRENPEEALKSHSAKKAGAKDFEQAQNEEPLKGALPIFQDSLAKAIGPIAAMLTKETVEKWLLTGDCAKERFPELVDMFCQEIGDDALEQEFRKDVAATVSS